MEVFISVICALIIVIVGAFLVGKFYNFFVKSRGILLIVALLLGIIVYSIGYWGTNYKFSFSSVITVGLQSLFSSARFFIFDSDYSLLVNKLVVSEMWYMFIFALSGIFTMFVTATTVLSAFGMSAIMRIKLSLSINRVVYIILGINEDSVALASEIRKTNKKPLIVMIDSIEKSKQQELFRVAARDKIILLKRDLSNTQLQSRFYLSKLTYHRLFHTNVKLSVVITDCAGASNAGALINLMQIHKPKQPVSLHCVTEIDAIRQAIFGTDNASWDIRVDSYADLVADSVIAQYPVINYLTIDHSKCNVTAQPRIMICGSSKVAEKLAYALIGNSQYEGYLPCIDIVGEQSDSMASHIMADAPEINYAADVKFHHCKIDSSEFYSLVTKGNYDYHVICDGDDATNLDVAERLRKMTPKSTSAVLAYAEADDYRKFKRNGAYGGVEIIGSHKEIYSYSVVIEGKLDRTAVGVNMHYNGTDNYYCRPYFDRASSKSFGLNIPTKLAMLSLQLCAIDDQYAISADEYMAILEPHIDTFARQEHLRWNAFHYCAGFKRWNISDIPVDCNATKDMTRKLHACLVTYDDLDAVSERFHYKVKDVVDGYKGYDSMLVKAVPQILKYCNLGIKKINKE